MTPQNSGTKHDVTLWNFQFLKCLKITTNLCNTYYKSSTCAWENLLKPKHIWKHVRDNYQWWWLSLSFLKHACFYGVNNTSITPFCMIPLMYYSTYPCRRLILFWHKDNAEKSSRSARWLFRISLYAAFRFHLTAISPPSAPSVSTTALSFRHRHTAQTASAVCMKRRSRRSLPPPLERGGDARLLPPLVPECVW